VQQICEKIVGLVLKAPKLAQIMLNIHELISATVPTQIFSGTGIMAKKSKMAAIAFVQILKYFLEETRNSNKDVTPVFGLADLVRLYSNRLQDLGIEQAGRVHSTDLKNRLLANIPGIRAFRQGRDMILTFDSDVGTTLKEATLTDDDDEALCLAKAAQIVRRDMQLKSSTFSGTFESNCQEEAVPSRCLL